MRIEVPQATLDDLKRRLEAARWPDAYALDGGERVGRLDRIRELLDRWRGGYDWREHEARINEYEQEMVNGLHVLRAVLIAAAHGATPDPAAHALLMHTYAEAAAAAHLSARDGAYVLDWAGDDPRKIRFAVTADAIALLADAGRLQRVHVCPGRNCGWLFLNKTGRQRWCSMQTCGSRAKMRAMYARRHAA